MRHKNFRKLYVPERWEHYWSKYPEGYTILEALLNWVNQVDDMTDNVNKWNDYLKEFVETFDEKLQPTIIEFLKEMEEDGRLSDIVNEVLFQNKVDKKDFNKLVIRVDRLEDMALTFEDFGAVGDGVTDDTAALQEAIDYAAARGLKIESLPNKEYKVSIVGTTRYDLNSSHNTSDYSLLVPDNTDIDFNGSKLVNRDFDYCSLLTNEGLRNTPKTTNDNIRIVNLGTRGNINVGYKSNRYNPHINFVGVTNLHLDGIDNKDGLDVGTRILKVDDFYIGSVRVFNFKGSGLYAGIWKEGGEDTRCHNGHIEYLYTEDLYETDMVTASNSLIATLVNVSIGTVSAVNCSWGTKIQNDSENVTIGTSIFNGGELSTVNSGLRIQGVSNTQSARNIVVGKVISHNCGGPGLYVQYSDSVEIGEYVGENNGKLGYTDVWLHRKHIKIGSISVSNAASGGVQLRDGSFDIDIGSITLKNVKGNGVVDTSLNSKIGRLYSTNTNPAYVLERLIVTSSTSTDTKYGLVTNYSNAVIAVISKFVEIDRYVVNSGDPFVYELVANNTRLEIMNDNILFQNDGTGSHVKTLVEIEQLTGPPMVITNKQHINGGYRIDYEQLTEVVRVLVKVGKTMNVRGV